MDLRDYQEMPDQGLFEKIQRRLLLRRVAWWTGIVVAVAAVVTVVAILMPGQPSDGVEQTVPVAENTVVAEELQAEPMAMTKEHSLAVVKETVVRVPETAVPATVTIAQEPIAAEAVSVVNLEQNTMVEVETPVSNVSMDIEEKSVVDIETEPVNEAMSNTKAGQSTPEQPHVDNVLWAPNAILPNGENAQNRQFKVIATSPVTHFRMIIYNRGGRQVFETNDINRAWDASIGGMQAPQGTYVWVAKFRDSDGVLRQEKGTVTVIR